jgi:hypothetical protein
MKSKPSHSASPITSPAPRAPGRTILLLLAAVGLILTPVSPAAAELCSLDRTPGATLLLPYFEVDTSNPSGRTTLLSVANADDQGTLAQVVMWSEFAIPVLVFQVYLEPFDVLPINLRDVLNGQLPATSPPPGVYEECPAMLPALRPDYPPLVPFLRDAFSGREVTPSTLPGSQSVAYGRDSAPIARGFVTLDAASDCSLLVPGDAGYFIQGGGGVATNRNILWGNSYYVEPADNFAQGAPLVALEADGADPRTSTPGNYTFYAGAEDGMAVDNREPLGTVHQSRFFTFVSGGPLDRLPQLVYWRDLRGRQAPLEPGTLPRWFPLGQDQIVIYDEQGDAFVASGVTPFPAAAGRVEVGGGEFPVPVDSGWLYLDLNTEDGLGTVSGAPGAAQSFVTGIFSAFGAFSASVESFDLDNACDPQPVGSPGS